ncbi:unnamed protein product [Brassica napus]|uniref:(rape) hypothetical protein n=1 Tax=Brassica napus TaxID=3708 RepID=A0A816Z0F5_BRANA|nr:unnamed protein product [Brassica napus]
MRRKKHQWTMVAEYSAEAILRRIHALQNDDFMPPIEAILAPLEAELKLAIRGWEGSRR